MIPEEQKQELYNQLVELLNANELFFELPNQQQIISKLATRAKFEDYKQGYVIMTKGDPVDEFLIIISGQLRAIDTDTKPARLLNFMHAGQFVGELGLLNRKNKRGATVDVSVDCTVARFTEHDWAWLLRSAPELKIRLEAYTEEYIKHAEISFAGKQSDEVAIKKLKRHIFAYIAALPGPLILLLMGLVIGWLINDLGFLTHEINIGFVGFVAGVSLLWAIYFYVEWANDDFIISTKRVVHIERIILGGIHREETPLTQVMNVGVSTDNFFTRVFGFSNVVIKTAGLGNIIFDGINEGDKIKELVFQLVEDAKQRVVAGDISAIRRSLAEQIGWEGEEPLEAKPLEVVDNTALRRVLKVPAIIRYYIPHVKETTPEGITWRKHYLIWLQKVWLPMLVGLVVLYLAMAAGLGMAPFLRASTHTAMFLASVLLFIFLWYTYQHDDWHKDTYRITATQIIHQDSTAFRLRGEQIHETTFDNVQNINYNVPDFTSRLFRIGNVIIKTATVGEPFIFENVYFPRSVQQDIFQYWVTFKENKRHKNRKEEEERFTTWLGEYHRLMRENG